MKFLVNAFFIALMVVGWVNWWELEQAQERSDTACAVKMLGAMNIARYDLELAMRKNREEKSGAKTFYEQRQPSY